MSSDMSARDKLGRCLMRARRDKGRKSSLFNPRMGFDRTNGGVVTPYVPFHHDVAQGGLPTTTYASLPLDSCTCDLLREKPPSQQDEYTSDSLPSQARSACSPQL